MKSRLLKKRVRFFPWTSGKCGYREKQIWNRPRSVQSVLRQIFLYTRFCYEWGTDFKIWIRKTWSEERYTLIRWSHWPVERNVVSPHKSNRFSPFFPVFTHFHIAFNLHRLASSFEGVNRAKRNGKQHRNRTDCDETDRVIIFRRSRGLYGRNSNIIRRRYYTKCTLYPWLINWW